jgi:hypothetical protein
MITIHKVENIYIISGSTGIIKEQLQTSYNAISIPHNLLIIENIGDLCSNQDILNQIYKSYTDYLAKLPEELLKYIFSKVDYLNDLFITSKFYQKFYKEFEDNLLKSALVREARKIGDEFEIGNRFVCDRTNVKVLNNHEIVEVNAYGKIIGPTHKYSVKIEHGNWSTGEFSIQKMITIEGFSETTRGFILFKDGPIIKSFDSVYLRHKFSQYNNFDHLNYTRIENNLEPELDMIAILYDGCSCILSLICEIVDDKIKIKFINTQQIITCSKNNKGYWRNIDGAGIILIGGFIPY